MTWCGASCNLIDLSSPTETFVYVLPSRHLSFVRETLAAHPLSAELSIQVESVDEYPSDVSGWLAEALPALAGAPLGVITETARDAYEALAAGADEAMVLTELDAPTLVAFIDRLRFRATRRAEHERLTRDITQAERLTALGTLMAGVVHEMNNPLAAITLMLGVAKESLPRKLERLASSSRDETKRGPPELAKLGEDLESTASEVRELFHDLSLSTESVARLAGDLRVFSRRDEVETASLFEVSDAVDQALRLAHRELATVAIIERDYDENLPQLYLPRNRLIQVLTNLLVNAAHALREVERPTHQVRISARVDEQFMALSVEDTGPGIPESSLERIFDPFFTTKRAELGTGLGLSISRSILRDLGGDLLATSVFGQGATFICMLPRASNATGRESTPSFEAPVSTNSPRTTLSVLLVDDDDRVLRAESRVLGERYKVIVAHDGREAIELLSSGSHADVVVTELDMPDVSGLALYEWLTQHRPELASRVVVATGASERRHFQAVLRNQNFVILHKPFTREALLSAVESVTHVKANSLSNGA